jgi:hypothetical protein
VDGSPLVSSTCPRAALGRQAAQLGQPDGPWSTRNTGKVFFGTARVIFLGRYRRRLARACLFGDRFGYQLSFPLFRGWITRRSERSFPRSTHQPAGQSVWPRRGRVSAFETIYTPQCAGGKIPPGWFACARWVAVLMRPQHH